MRCRKYSGCSREIVCRTDETSRQALGRFLRERRERTKPEAVGISSTRGRRTPGLRREEVAFLADIGVKWYARLEAGDEIHPSAATLTGIAIALRLSNAELEYVLELAGVRQPQATSSKIDLTMPEPVSALLNNLSRSRGFDRRSHSHAAPMECVERCTVRSFPASTAGTAQRAGSKPPRPGIYCIPRVRTRGARFQSRRNAPAQLFVRSAQPASSGQSTTRSGTSRCFSKLGTSA